MQNVQKHVVLAALLGVLGGCGHLTENPLEKLDIVFKEIENYETFQTQLKSLQAFNSRDGKIIPGRVCGGFTGGFLPSSDGRDDTDESFSSTNDASCDCPDPSFLYPK